MSISLHRQLNDTYRALEARMRQNNCQACHAPDNQGNSAQLELFVYPNQCSPSAGTSSRSRPGTRWPPRSNTLNPTASIACSAGREVRINLAHDFESAGDQALPQEGDHKT